MKNMANLQSTPLVLPADQTQSMIDGYVPALHSMLETLQRVQPAIT